MYCAYASWKRELKAELSVIPPAIKREKGRDMKVKFYDNKQVCVELSIQPNAMK